MYEKLRNDFIVGLTGLDKQQIDTALLALDKAARNYEITEKETALAIIGQIPQEARLFLATKKLEGLSEKSIDLYANRLKMFFERVPKTIQNIEANDVRLFLAEYKAEKGISDRTLDKIRQIVCLFFAWALSEGYIQRNPCLNIKNIKYEVEPRHSLTRFELERLRRACGVRELAIVDTLFSTGLRVSELCGIKLEDINTEDYSIQVVGKGRKHNTVYLNDRARLSLMDYMQIRPESNYLFSTKRSKTGRISANYIEQIFRRLSTETGIKVTPHTMRHTFATLSLQQGMPLEVVQRCLAHASVATTQIYAETSQQSVITAHKRYVV